MTRSRRRWAPSLPVPLPVFVASAALLLALAGCDALDSASSSLDKAQVCSKAIAAAGYTPDLSDPTRSVREADQRAEQLRELSGRTADADLQRELRSMADQLGSLKPGEVNPSGVASWSTRKLTQLRNLQEACGP